MFALCLLPYIAAGMLALILCLLLAPVVADPKVRLYDEYNNALNVIVPKGISKGGTVKYIGTFDSVQQCQSECIAQKDRCWHFVHLKKTQSYTISVKATGLNLHANDLGDELLSTRYSVHDEYTKFTIQDAGDGVSKRLRTVADSRMVHADDLGDMLVSTRHQDDDDYNHFVLSNKSDGTVSIATKASGRFWYVDKDQIVKTTTNEETAASFAVKKDKLINGECYAIFSPGFNPSYDDHAITGSVAWECRDDEDCSLNGKCQNGICQCRVAWSGLRCEMLNTLPPSKSAGYRGVDDGHNTSSWGGAVLKAADGTYHMWASEMTEHCGIGAWVQNSRIIHATSEYPGGPYIRKDVTWGVFAHEPEVVPGPTGEYVMYFTSNPRPDGGEHGWCNCCRPGHGPCDGSTGPGDCPGDSPGEGDSYMSWTTDPNGNWSKKVKIFADYRGGDTNFAPLILPNGSLIGLWRRWEGNRGSRQYVATGSDWKDPSTYIQHETELFPDMGGAGTEDQFVYQDTDGNFHAWFHHMYGTGTFSQWWLDATGGHAYSRDGLTWTYTGVSWGDPLSRYNTQKGQGASVRFDDGTTIKFTRVERPHFVFAGRQFKGDPIYITNSAQYGMGTDPGSGAENDDACYTLVMPVRHSQHVTAFV